MHPKSVISSREVAHIHKYGFSYPRTYFEVHLRPYIYPVFYYAGLSKLVRELCPSLHAGIKAVLQRLRKPSVQS
jgi:hypothetical protein